MKPSDHAPHAPAESAAKGASAFTLVELLVSMTITSLLLVLLVQMVGMTQKTWRATRSQSESYRAARAAFESLSRQLSQATLNNYWDYNDPNNPTFYQRQSELHYVSGPASDLLGAHPYPAAGHAVFFQAPLGVDHLDVTDKGAALDQALNAWGYFVEYNSDLPQRPAFMNVSSAVNPEKKRFRLMEFRLPTEEFNLFQMPAGATAGTRPLLHTASTPASLYSWFRTPLPTHAEPIADNILALIIQPVTPAAASPAGSYLYDTRGFQLTGSLSPQLAASRHQLPPTVRLTLIALDEESWTQLDPTDAALQMLLQKLNGSLFASPAKFDEDLAELTRHLTQDLKLQHRVFTSTIPIRTAKWHTAKEQAAPTP